MSKAINHMRKSIWFSVVSVIFVFFQITGFFMARDSAVNWSVSKTTLIIIASLVGGGVLGNMVYHFKQYIDKCNKRNCTQKIEAKNYYKYLISFATLTLIGYCIVWLIYFPGICSYDFFTQITQGIKNEFTNHHPLLHTLFVRLCWNIGFFNMGNASFGIAIYCAIQMIASVIVFTYGAWLMLRAGCNRILFAVATLFSCVFPLHGFMVCTVTKDSLFSVFSLLYVLVMIDIIWLDKKLSLKKGTIFIAAIFGTIVLRNNGRYAMIAALFVLLLLVCFRKKERKFWSKIAVTTIIAFALSLGILKAVEVTHNCGKGDPREMLSVPIQQIARVVNKYPDALSEEQYAVLYECIDKEAMESYLPFISDPVKTGVNTRNIVNNAEEFIRIYLELFIKYPDEYVDAFLAMIAGFVYIDDVTSAWINNSGEEKTVGYGYIQTGTNVIFLESIGVRNMTFFPEIYERAQEWVTYNKHLDVPILRHLMAPGIWLYIMLFIFANDMTNKCCKNLSLYGFLGGYYVTLFLGPASQMRYIYPMMLCIAFGALLYLTQKLNENR